MVFEWQQTQLVAWKGTAGEHGSNGELSIVATSSGSDTAKRYSVECSQLRICENLIQAQA
jgi:hypothetical protein